MDQYYIPLHLSRAEEEEVVRALREWQNSHRNDFYQTSRQKAVEEVLGQLENRVFKPHGPKDPCTCHNGSGCALVPVHQW